jgi:energy-coupling factor transport system substrate-specific component
MTAAAIVALGGLAALLLGLVLYERTRGGARELGLVAVLVAAATAGRIAFAAIPSAQPVTAIAIVTGVALGPRAGAAVGAGAALLSNTFLGQGPWTPWQMLLWGLAGASGGWLGPVLRRSRVALMAFGGAWGLVFGAGMDVWQLAAFGPALSLPAFIAVHARAVPFDLVHALTNVILLGVAGLPLIALLDRSARRMRGRWLPVGEAE